MKRDLVRPYRLVLVSQNGYRHCGEVMSFPTTTDTVMVRRVPGHSGTLNELQLEQLDGIANMRWVHYAQVEPSRGERDLEKYRHWAGFPVDMLRYDFAAPVNFSLEWREFGAQIEIDRTHGFDVLLVARATVDRESRWTPERWQSFGWDLTPIRSERIHEPR